MASLAREPPSTARDGFGVEVLHRARSRARRRLHGAPAATAKLTVWPIIAWSSVIAIVVGVRRNRPTSPGAWYLLAAGVATFASATTSTASAATSARAETSFPSYVDLVYLAVYPLLIAGLVVMVRRRTTGRDRASVIDAGIITASVGLVAWVFLIAPYVRSDDLGIVERLVSIAYPLGDIALLAIAVRLAVGAGRRPPAFWLLAGCIVPLIAADSLYGYLNLPGAWHEHNIVDIGWIVFYVGWGAAALHPSMAQLTVASPSRAQRQRAPPHPGRQRRAHPAGRALRRAGRRRRGRRRRRSRSSSAVTFVLVMIRVAGLAGEVADERSETRFQTLIDNASDAILVVDAAGVVQYHTPSSERVLGGDRSDARRSAARRAARTATTPTSSRCC